MQKELKMAEKQENLEVKNIHGNLIVYNAPDALSILNDKLSNELQSGGLDLLALSQLSNDKVVELEISKQGAKKKIITPVVLYYNDSDPNLNFRTIKPWTAYDRAVHDAVATLYEAEYRYFTPAMVYRVMNGLTEDERVSPQAQGAVTKSLEKARMIRLMVNYSDVYNAYKKNTTKENDEFTVDSQVLDIKRFRAKAGGNIFIAYEFLGKPLLLEYAQITKQILNIPFDLLNTKAIRNTEDVIVIKSYLLRQIEAIKRNRRNNHIKYDTIYKELGIENPEDRANRTKLYRARGSIKKLLEEWTSKEYIKGYEEYNKRGSKGVIIRVMDELE